MLMLIGLMLWLLPVQFLPDPMPENWRWRDWTLTILGLFGMCLATLGVVKWGLFLLLFIVRALTEIPAADWIRLWGLI